MRNLLFFQPLCRLLRISIPSSIELEFCVSGWHPVSNVREFAIGNCRVGGDQPLFLIAGPCVIESETHAAMLAERLAALTREAGIPFIFKASFDKANRTSVSSYRGPGLKEGLRILAAIRKQLSVPVLTDVHDPSQVGPAAEACDALQIPAFLCRQTDLLVAAGKSGCAVNLKKGQFLSPWEMANAVEKVAGAGNQRILVTERGTSFGYQNLVVDMRSFPMLRRLGYPIVFDATHSVQLPGGEGKSSGGQPEFIEPLTRAATAVGVNGIFLEVHEDPSRALSDGTNALKLSELPPLLKRLAGLSAFVRGWDQR